jgi:flavin reductase (DIM6/NTAB) family NADH-FMN oxidoreductase RutF
LIEPARSLKQRLRKLANFPRYGPVGLRDPQQEVQVWLHGLGEPMDVTRNNVVAALRPFMLGVMLERSRSENLNGQPMRLCMHELREPRRLLGAIHMRLVRRISLPEHDLCLFETSGFDNYCVGPLRLRLYDFYGAWQAEARQRQNPFNFRMTPADVRCSHVFYICPRPVVLVTVEHEGAGNMFPMDLIGPTDSPWFTMALRSTSPAVRLMQQSRHMALASVPISYKAAAYEMGKHHRKTSIDWAQLPFRTIKSQLFGLPVAEMALRVREVQVQEVQEVGSHFLFITSIQSDTLPRPVAEGECGLQLFHSFSSYRQFLLQQDAPRLV